MCCCLNSHGFSDFAILEPMVKKGLFQERLFLVFPFDIIKISIMDRLLREAAIPCEKGVMSMDDIFQVVPDDCFWGACSFIVQS